MDDMNQANEEFFEKLKSLTFGFGAKPDDKCPGCGQPFKNHKLKLVGVGMIVAVPKNPKVKTQPPPEPLEQESKSDEQIAFAM